MVETKDLILRQGNEEDWTDLYHNLWKHDSVFRFLFSRPSPTQEAARKKTAAYAQMHREVSTEFFVIEKASMQAIGIAGIKQITSGIYTVTDIALGPAFSGRGYGKQILTALTELAFFQYQANELHYSCFQQNEASRKLALSCGFQFFCSMESEVQKDHKSVMLDYYRRYRNHV